MKTSTRFTIFVFLLSAVTWAQPVITPDTRDVIGQELPIKFFGTFSGSPGDAGMDQTWDFSFLGSQTPTSSFSWIPNQVDNTAFRDSFPQANLAIQVPPALIGRDSAEAFFYYDVAADGNLYYYGYAAIIPDSAFANGRDTFLIIYDDPALDAAFPSTFGDSFNNEWTQTTSFTTDTLSFTQYRWGVRTLTNDGYGTLITPAGTFENALRVRREEVVRDSTIFPGLPVQLPSQVSQINTYWDWYAPGEAYLLMQITESRIFANGFEVSNSTSAFYRDRGPSTSTAFITPESIDLKAYPNPGRDNIRLSFTPENAGVVTVQIITSDGRLVRQAVKEQYTRGQATVDLAVNDLPAGTYHAVVLLPEGISRTKFVVIQ